MNIDATYRTRGLVPTPGVSFVHAAFLLASH